MGKRSDFARRERDCYDTPLEAVLPLLPHLKYGTMFVEPCAGAGALIQHLEANGMSCQRAFDVEPRGPWIERQDVLEEGFEPCSAAADMVITNPPWQRATLHEMIRRFSRLQPAWLLFDADWVHTRQAAPYLPWLRRIVSIGRVKWIADSPYTGKDNCAWHLFDQQGIGPAVFYGREQVRHGEGRQDAP
jgi:hypothetical protein